MKVFNLMVLAIVLLTSCSGPKIVNSWRDPAVTVDTANLNKFMVAALLKNPTVRRQVEDQMASVVPGKAIQSYKEFGMGELKDNDDAYNQQLKAKGFDGVVIMRITSIDSSQRWVAGSYPSYYYGGWRGYWGASWNGFYQPSYVTTDQTYNIEVNVYSLKSNKLIWTGSSTALNPDGGSSDYRNISREVYRKMRLEKFIR